MRPLSNYLLNHCRSNRAVCVGLLLAISFGGGCALIGTPNANRRAPIVTLAKVPEPPDSAWAVAKANEAMTRAYNGKIPFKPVEFSTSSGGYLIYVTPVQAAPDRLFLDAGGVVWVGLNGYVVVLTRGG